VDTQERKEMPNPLRALYEEVAPLLLRSPPSERYPQEPTGRKEWDILTDPLSELIVTSAVPDPVIGLTLQRMMRPTIEGKEGLATHLFMAMISEDMDLMVQAWPVLSPL